jgi:threonine synthase
VPVCYSALSHLDCPRCGARHDADRIQGTCSCGSPLLARYDLRRVAGQASPRGIAGRPADLWRYHELLPVRDSRHVVSLGEGMTPLLALPRLGRALGLPDLRMKDEGLIPTGTFKARGAAVGVSRAAELGVTAIAMPTNGNAGAAWSAYAARAGMRSLVVMPVGAPPVTRAQCAAAGAELYLVDGLIGDAGRLVGDAVARRPGYQNVATLNEPYRIEGKKTMGLEIAEQLGWRMPGVVLYPTGGGVGLIGIHKALRELLELGWVSGDLPRLVAVQSAGCAPIVRAFQAGASQSEPWPDARTAAFGLTVPKPSGDFLILQALYATGGTAVAVTDEDLLAEQQEVARLEGCFICPEGAACFAAVRQLRASGWLSEADEVVVLNTGTGLIYPDARPAHVPVLPPSGSIPALSAVSGLAPPGRLGEQPGIDSVPGRRVWRAGRGDIEAAAVGQVVAATGNDAAQPADRRDIGPGIAVHDDEVGVVAGGQAPGDRADPERCRGLGGGHGEHLLGPEAQRHEVLQPAEILVVRGVVDARVGTRDDPHAHVVHRLDVLAHRDAGQRGDVRRIDVDGRADVDSLRRDPGGEGFVEAPLVGLGHERAVLERGDSSLDRPPDALDAVSVRGDWLVDSPGLLDDHG